MDPDTFLFTLAAAWTIGMEHEDCPVFWDPEYSLLFNNWISTRFTIKTIGRICDRFMQLKTETSWTLPLESFTLSVFGNDRMSWHGSFGGILNFFPNILADFYNAFRTFFLFLTEYGAFSPRYVTGLSFLLVFLLVHIRTTTAMCWLFYLRATTLHSWSLLFWFEAVIRTCGSSGGCNAQWGFC